MEKFLVYEQSIFQFLPSLIPFLLLGIFAYFGLTYLTDKKTKKLYHAIFSEIRGKQNKRETK